MSRAERPGVDEAEERASALRHVLRNRLAAIRNAAYYLQRKAKKAGLMEDDPRVGQFFELIGKELMAADEIVGAQVTAAHLLDGPPDDEASES